MNVDFVTAIKMFFANYANFKGRSSRAEYWWVILFMALVSSALGILGTFGNYINFAFSLACLIPGMALATRRLHDIGKSGWWLVIFYVVMGASFIWITTVFMMKAPELLSGDPAAVAQLSNEMDELNSIISSLAIPYLALFCFGIWWIVLMCKKSAPDNQYGPNPYGEY